MISLSCPKCRHALTDAALDAEACPLCGYPLVGPIVLTPASRPTTRWMAVPFAVAAVGLLVAVGYLFATRERRDAAEVAATVPAPADSPSGGSRPSLAEVQIAPMPRAVLPKAETPVDVTPEPKKAVRPVGVVMKVDPKITPKRHFDAPDDTAALPDLRTGDKVVLTGRVRVLRIGSVSGNGVLDASALTAEEVHITGDLNGESQIVLNAPNGVITVGGYVSGAAKVTIAAPGGSVTVAGSGRIANGALLTATAKSVEVKCPISDGARLQLTLTAGGALKLTRTEDGASVTYWKANPADPPLTIERGVLRDRATVFEGKLPR